MPRLLVVLAGVLAVAAAGCSGGDDESAGTPSDTAAVGVTAAATAVPVATAGSTAVPPASADDAAPAAGVDCAALHDPSNTGGLLTMQVIPQITSQQQIDSIKSGALSVDPDGLIEYLQLLAPFAGMDTPFGEPSDAITRNREAAEAAKALLDVEGPVPQARLDAYVALIGDPSTFVAQQASIGYAISETCD